MYYNTMLRHLIIHLGYISHALLQYHIPHEKTGHLNNIKQFHLKYRRFN